MHHRVDIAILCHELLRVDFLAARKALRCPRRIAISIKSCLYRWAALLARDIRLILRQALDQKRRAARRPQRLDRIIGEPELRQCLGSIFLQLHQDSRHRMSRNLFRTNFQQQILAHACFPLFNIG